MKISEVSSLDGRSILVRPTHSEHNPPIGVRGTIRVLSKPEESPPRAEIVLDFPDMFSRPAEQKIIPLSEADLQRLLLIQPDGDCTFFYDGKLD